MATHLPELTKVSNSTKPKDRVSAAPGGGGKMWAKGGGKLPEFDGDADGAKGAGSMCKASDFKMPGPMPKKM